MTAAAPGAPRRRLIRGETRDAWIFITPALIGQALWLGLLFPVIPTGLELLALRRLTAAAFGIGPS